MIGFARKIAFFSVLLLCLLTATGWMLGCSKTPLAPPPVNASDEFPTQVGSEWTYEIHDLVNPVNPDGSANFDTVRVRIQKDTTLSDGRSGTEWVFIRKGALYDRHIVLIERNRVAIWREKELDSTAVDFPLYDRKVWSAGGRLWGDSIKVIGVTAITVPAGVFKPVYAIAATKRTTNLEDIRIIKSWFVSGFGYVAFERIYIRPGYHVEEQWVLIGHNIDGF